MHDCRMHLGCRAKSLGRQRHHDPRIATPLGQQGEAPIVVGPRLCHDPLGHLFLEHQCQRGPDGWPDRGRQPANQQLCPHVIGQVRDDLDRVRQMGGKVQRQRVALHDGQPPRIDRCDLGQCRQTARVLFHRHHPPRSLSQKPTRQAARTGPHLQHIAGRKVPRRPRDLRCQVQIQQEILPKLLLCHQVMGANDVTQGRQTVYRSQTPVILSAQLARGCGGWPLRRLRPRRLPPRRHVPRHP